MIDKLRNIKIRLISSDQFIFKISIVKKALNLVLTLNFIRYLIIGFSTFFMQIVLLYIFNVTMGIEKVSANVISTLISIIFNFIMSNYYTFKAGSSSKRKKLSKYISLALFNYCFDVIIAFPILTLNLGINQYVAKILITGMIVGWNFFIYKLWVFKN